MGMMPRTRRLQVAGIFSLGPVRVRFDLSASCRSTSPSALLGKDQVDLIQLRVDDIYAAPRIARVDPGDARRRDYVDAGLGRHEPVAVLGARRSRRWPISLTIGLIVMVAALNIVASLILLVMEKHRDIAHPEDDGRERAERDDHLHDAGADHRHRRHDGRRVGRLRAVDAARSLQADSRARWTSTRCRTCRSRVLPRDFAAGHRRRHR